jgi:hypothetical protein
MIKAGQYWISKAGSLLYVMGVDDNKVIKFCPLWDKNSPNPVCWNEEDSELWLRNCTKLTKLEVIKLELKND